MLWFDFPPFTEKILYGIKMPCEYKYKCSWCKETANLIGEIYYFIDEEKLLKQMEIITCQQCDKIFSWFVPYIGGRLSYRPLFLGDKTNFYVKPPLKYGQEVKIFDQIIKIVDKTDSFVIN